MAFRDFLREHAEVAGEYAKLKPALAPQFSASEFDSREAYADAKGEFIERITRSAREQGYPREPSSSVPGSEGHSALA